MFYSKCLDLSNLKVKEFLDHFRSVDVGKGDLYYVAFGLPLSLAGADSVPA